MDDDVAQNLLTTLGVVAVVACPMCEASGKLPLGLGMVCPRCKGCGLSTRSEQPIERWDIHEHRRP